MKGGKGMEIDGRDWRDDFPILEDVEDCCGSMRNFSISCHEGGLGYTVLAVEEGKEGEGYEFRAYSETSPYSALGRVRDKTQRELARRYVSRSSGFPELLHDRMRGLIRWSEKDGMQLMVDGLPLAIDDLARILGAHEGWEFELRIVDALK